jgi:hypothetical protein
MNGKHRSFAPTASRQSGSPEAASVFLAFAPLILAAVVNLTVFAELDQPIVCPALGFWYVIILASYLLSVTSAWRGCALQERLGYSVCPVLLILMLTGLVINEVLPLVGVQPLRRSKCHTPGTVYFTPHSAENRSSSGVARGSVKRSEARRLSNGRPRASRAQSQGGLAASMADHLWQTCAEALATFLSDASHQVHAGDSRSRP